MKFLFLLLMSVSWNTALAKNKIYEFKNKQVVVVDMNTGKPVTDENIVVYHWYEYPCLTDLIRPSKCVNGSTSTLPLKNGKLSLPSQKIEKTHLLGKNPKVGFQVNGQCENFNCTTWVPLSEFNDSSEPIEIKIPFRKSNAQPSSNNESDTGTP